MYYFIGPVTTFIQDESLNTSPSWLRIPTNLLVKSERLVVVVVSAAGILAVETVHVAQADRTACACGGGSAMPDGQLSAAARTGRRMSDDDEDYSATKKTISAPAFLVFVLSGLAVSLLCVLIVCAYKLRVRNRKQVEVCGNQLTVGECDKNKPANSNTTKANRSAFYSAEKGRAHSVFEDDAGENHSKVRDMLSDEGGIADETASNPSSVYEGRKMSQLERNSCSSGQPTDKTRTDSEDIDWGHYEDIYISRSVYV
jgi:hypothetical protein